MITDYVSAPNRLNRWTNDTIKTHLAFLVRMHHEWFHLLIGLKTKLWNIQVSIDLWSHVGVWGLCCQVSKIRASDTLFVHPLKLVICVGYQVYRFCSDLLVSLWHWIRTIAQPRLVFLLKLAHVRRLQTAPHHFHRLPIKTVVSQLHLHDFLLHINDLRSKICFGTNSSLIHLLRQLFHFIHDGLLHFAVDEGHCVIDLIVYLASDLWVQTA